MLAPNQISYTSYVSNTFVHLRNITLNQCQIQWNKSTMKLPFLGVFFSFVFQMFCYFSECYLSVDLNRCFLDCCLFAIFFFLPFPLCMRYRFIYFVECVAVVMRLNFLINLLQIYICIYHTFGLSSHLCHHSHQNESVKKSKKQKKNEIILYIFGAMVIMAFHSIAFHIRYKSNCFACKNFIICATPVAGLSCRLFDK